MAQPSSLLTNLMLSPRSEDTKVPFSLKSQVYKLMGDESPPVWVFWGTPYLQIFSGICRCVRHLQTKDPRMSGRPIRVYSGGKHALSQFLDVPPDIHTWPALQDLL